MTFRSARQRFYVSAGKENRPVISHQMKFLLVTTAKSCYNLPSRLSDGHGTSKLIPIAIHNRAVGLVVSTHTERLLLLFLLNRAHPKYF
jgi:hypothetical protein